MKENLNSSVPLIKQDAELRSRVFEAIKRAVIQIQKTPEYKLPEANANFAIARLQADLVNNVAAATEEELLEIGKNAVLKRFESDGYDSGRILADLDVKSADFLKGVSSQTE